MVMATMKRPTVKRAASWSFLRTSQRHALYMGGGGWGGAYSRKERFTITRIGIGMAISITSVMTLRTPDQILEVGYC